MLCSIGFPQWLSGLRICLQCRSHRRQAFYPWIRKIPWREMATFSSILARKIPWTEEPGSLSPKGCKESDMTEHNTMWKAWNALNFLLSYTNARATGYLPHFMNEGMKPQWGWIIYSITSANVRIEIQTHMVCWTAEVLSYTCWTTKMQETHQKREMLCSEKQRGYSLPSKDLQGPASIRLSGTPSHGQHSACLLCVCLFLF